MSQCPVFDHLQYAKTVGGGLGLHTASDQKTGRGKAWEQGYRVATDSCMQLLTYQQLVNIVYTYIVIRPQNWAMRGGTHG